MTSLIDDYAKQTVIWKQRRKGAYDGHGQPARDASTISVRWEWSRKLIRNDQGQEVMSSGLCMTSNPVNPNDVLTAPDGKDYEVISVSVLFDLDGSESHREAYV